MICSLFGLWTSCGSVVEHCVSRKLAQRLWVQFPRNTHTDNKRIARMHCKLLWIKASAKCINVNVNEFNSLTQWISLSKTGERLSMRNDFNFGQFETDNLNNCVKVTWTTSVHFFQPFFKLESFSPHSLLLHEEQQSRQKSKKVIQV